MLWRDGRTDKWMQHFISYIKLPKTLTVTTLLFGPVTLLRCFVGWSVDISLLWVMSEESVPLWTPSNRHTSVLPTPSRLNARQRIGTWSLHWKGSVSGARENLFFRHFLYIPYTLARMGADHQFISISTGESKCNPADIVSICMSIYIHMTLRSNGRKWGRYDNVYLNLLTCLHFLYFSWLAVSLLPVFVSLYFKLHLRLFRTKHYDLLSLLHVQCH